MASEIHALTVDNFLDEEDYLELRELADKAEFEDTESPYDGTVYPDLYLDIPESIQAAVMARLSELMGEVVPTIMFMRKSVRGCYAPHQVHSDLIMGDFTLFLYLNREEHCEGGTALVEHIEEGIRYHPETQQELDIINKDMNKQDMWSVYKLLEMYPNRAAIMPASCLHRSEPVGGFGETNHDGRIVLIFFFRLEHDL